MKIVHLIDQFDYCDGCARHVFFLARSQKEAGHDVLVVAGRGDAFELLRHEQIPYREIGEIHHVTRSLVKFVRGAWLVRSLLSSLQPEIVHCHHFYAANEVRMLSRRWSLVLTHHANLPAEGWLPKFVGDMFIAVSKSTKAWILKNDSSLLPKVVVIPNASGFLGQENEVRSLPKFQEFLQKKSNAFVVAYVGRLTKPKGAQVLIAALSRIQSEVPALLIMAGTGEREVELKAQASLLSVNALFFGSVHDVRPLLEASDVVVIPSLSMEGLPMTLFEAGLLGKPVVASNTDGIPEVIRDGVSGILVKPGDAEQLANALRRLYADDPMRGRLGAALREQVGSNSISLMADRVMNVYQALARKHKT